MLLSEIFDQLTYGELSSLSIGGKKDGAGIAQKDHPEMGAHINLALTALYKIFPLKTAYVNIQQSASIYTYFITSDHSIIDGTADDLYLIDTVADRFQDDLLKIEGLYDEDGDLLYLNNINEDTSIFNDDYNSITLPNPVAAEIVQVKYRADHVNISHTNLDPTEVDVKIPRSLLEPLLFYVASRAFSSVPPIEGVSRSSQFLNKFETSVQRLKNLDLVNDEEKPNEKLEDNGWP